MRSPTFIEGWQSGSLQPEPAFGWFRCPSLECRSHSLELGERSGEVFNDLAGNDLGGRQIVDVFQRVVTQPGDGEIDLVPRDEFVLLGRRLLVEEQHVGFGVDDVDDAGGQVSRRTALRLSPCQRSVGQPRRTVDDRARSGHAARRRGCPTTSGSTTYGTTSRRSSSPPGST